jgi:hypothetical protein
MGVFFREEEGIIIYEHASHHFIQHISLEIACSMEVFVRVVLTQELASNSELVHSRSLEMNR